ncbi:MAG: decaprenyl-phosphate phosphoribosyltransferase [Planctomycetota bacterium]|nr:decaprenyl-phosphate phosphoribosyltransferase [Planctomycetota bacterium]
MHQCPGELHADHAAVRHALAVSLRPHHWVKNVLVFGALLFSHSLFDPAAILLSVQAYLAFCAAASAVYLLNDLNDFEEDRLHPTKRRRPLAAGTISHSQVLGAMCGLATLSLVSAFVSSFSLGVILSLYLAINVAYSLRLKRVEILDVMLIAGGFVLRAIGGCVAIGVPASPWLILCTLTLALLVGFGKRRNELQVLQDNAAKHRACLRNYSPEFLDMMMTVSAAAAVVSYALYTMADGTVARVGSHSLIITTPFVIYGVFRFLFLVHQKGHGGDPAKLFVADRPFVANAVLWIVTAAVAVYGPTDWMPW